MVVWVLIWIQTGVGIEHYNLGQHHSQASCLEAKAQADMLARLDTQVLHCLKIYTKGM